MAILSWSPILSGLKAIIREANVEDETAHHVADEAHESGSPAEGLLAVLADDPEAQHLLAGGGTLVRPEPEDVAEGGGHRQKERQERENRRERPGPAFADRRAHREERRRHPDDPHQDRDDDAVDQVGGEPDPEARRLPLYRRFVAEVGRGRCGRHGRGRHRGRASAPLSRSRRRHRSRPRRSCRGRRRHRCGPGGDRSRTRNRSRRRRRPSHRHGLRGGGRLERRRGGARRRRRRRGCVRLGDRRRSRSRLHGHPHSLDVQQGRSPPGRTRPGSRTPTCRRGSGPPASGAAR